jgi:alpha-beta hydrolase superfamily lysophospholipase
MLQINGISLHVEDLGSGRPVVLLHGWPDSSYLWRNQTQFLINNGFRAIASDLRARTSLCLGGTTKGFFRVFSASARSRPLPARIGNYSARNGR